MIAIFILFFMLNSCTAQQFAADFDHFEIMDGSEANYVLYWSHVAAEAKIKFKVVAKQSEWVGLGLSPNGGMAGSDIVMIWADENGDAFIGDYHRDDTPGFPIQDEKEISDWKLISFVLENNEIQAEFERAVETCDEQDFPVIGTSRVIFASGTLANGQPEKHAASKRSVRSLNLLKGVLEQDNIGDNANVEFIDFQFNGTATTGGRTRYWWHSFQWPTDEKVHIVGYDPLVPDGELAETHHMLLYACQHTFTELWVGDRLGTVPNELKRCNGAQPIASWAVGGGPWRMPAEAGLPIANNMALMIELHLDVVDERDFTSNAGLRMYYTRDLRENDAAILTIGQAVDQFLFIPPGQRTPTRGVCFAECLDRVVPDEGLTVVGSLLHMHTAGVEIRTRVVGSDGVEKEPMDANSVYDFDLQEFLALDPPRKIVKGDSLITECVYDATARTTPTLGGLSAQAEMCLHYLIVYPVPENTVSVCVSTGSDAMLLSLLVGGAFGATEFQQGVDDFGSFIARVDDWSSYASVRSSVEEQATINGICIRQNAEFIPMEIASKPQIATEFVAKNVCQRENEIESESSSSSSSSSSNNNNNNNNNNNSSSSVEINTNDSIDIDSSSSESDSSNSNRFVFEMALFFLALLII